MEVLRFLDGPLNLARVPDRGAPGLRMVVFSVLLMAVVLFRQRGLMGNREFSWSMLSRAGLLPRPRGAEAGRREAWRCLGPSASRCASAASPPCRDLDVADREGRDRRPHRAERRREDHRLQRDHRDEPRRREGRVFYGGEDITGFAAPRDHAARASRGRSRTSGSSRSSRSSRTSSSAATCRWTRASSRRRSTCPRYRRRDREARAFAMELLREVGLEAQRGRARHEPALRQAAAPRDRPRARDAPDDAPPRRARGRHEPAGVGRADALHPADPRPVRPHHPAHRAPHAGRDGRLRPDLRARVRRDHRRRATRRRSRTTPRSSRRTWGSQ